MFRMKALAEARLDGVYFERDPTALTPDVVDSELWDVVQAINRTRWAWTRYCCEGHWDLEEETYRCNPYLQIVSHRRHLSRVMAASGVAMTQGLSLDLDLHIMLGTEAASSNWVSCSLHVIDFGETGEETLPAARQIVQQFGWALTEQTVP
jgi:hypothetical protein